MSCSKTLAAGGKKAKEIQAVLDSYEGFQEMDLRKILKKIDYRIAVHKLFKPGKFEALCKYDRRRIKKYEKHLTIMWWLGEFLIFFNLFIFTTTVENFKC